MVVTKNHWKSGCLSAAKAIFWFVATELGVCVVSLVEAKLRPRSIKLGFESNGYSKVVQMNSPDPSVSTTLREPTRSARTGFIAKLVVEVFLIFQGTLERLTLWICHSMPMKLSLKSMIIAGALFNALLRPYGGAYLAILMSLYPGYDAVSGPIGIIVGTFYSLLAGGLAGFLFGWLYNFFAEKS